MNFSKKKGKEELFPQPFWVKGIRKRGVLKIY
jgi:hypothetical protein